MNIKKIWLTLLSFSGIIIFFLAITSGKVYAGGIISDEVDGDLLHKTKKPKPTLFVRTATPTITPTYTITPTPTPTNTSTTTLISSTPTKTKVPVSVDNAEAVVAPPIAYGPVVYQPMCTTPPAMAIGFAGIMWMKLRKRKDNI